MVTTGMDHNVFERSLIILENEHACTEDKIVACVELEGYFNIISKNKTDITPQPIRNLWEKLVRVLLDCLEKKNTKLHAPVLQTLKIGIQVLPKGLGLGMQLASQCYSILLKTCQEKEENIESSYKTHVLVELFRCLSRFDDPQFIDAITSTGVGYTEHKGLINKCVECNLDIPDNKDQQEVDLWISYLRLESLYFTRRLMKLCGALLKSHFVEDLDFWLELLLPHLFTFNEFYNSALGKDCGSDTRKATREAIEVLLTLIPPEEQIKLENWPKIKKDIKDNYADKMVKLVGIIPDWASVWCTVLDVLDGELIRKGNNHLINKLLNVEERAFKYDRTEVRVQAFICWRHLVDKFLPHGIEVSSDAVQRSVRLLIQPLQPNNAKTDIMSRQKLNTWWHLVRHLETGMEKHLKSVLVPFLNYCFGSPKSKEIAPGKKFPALHIPCAKVLAYVLDLEPVRQPVPDSPMDITNVEECIVHPCSVPLLSNCNLFLNVSEDLFHCVGESIVILSSRSENSVCSQLLITIWNSLLRHIAVILNANDIAPERVVKLIQDLLRLVQSLTERSNSAAPSLANHCISSVLEGLIIGPHALPPSVLSSPSYYVGSAQLMTGTPALFLMEIMVSRPLLQHATSHSRYIPILKVILDIGIHHHKVLEFMQSVMKQLETVAGAYYNVNTVERSSLCTVWSNVAQTLTEYLKDHHCVNQGNDKHHDLGCLYMVLLFPFYHFYSISYKQTLETLEVWRELYKTFHHAAIQSVPTLDMNEICETVTLKINQALTKHCPIIANQALPLLQAMQNIITTIPFSDICRQSVKSKTKFLLLPDRGRSSKPTSYITNTMSLIVKMSQIFAMYERSGECYNTVGSLIMNCLESLFKNMKAANVAAAVPMVSGFSDSVLSLLQANPVQDGTTKFWTESLQRMWRCYFTFIETYVPQKSVKDFLGWMSVLLEVGFKHSDVEIRNITVEFWDSIVVPAFDLDKTNVPQALKEAREKCIVKGNDDIPNIDISNSSDKDKPIPDTVFAVPNEAEKPKKAHQSLVQQLTDKGHILTKHQKEVFRRQKDDIPALYSSTLQPAQENSILSESSLDTSDFIAPQRIMETTTSSGEFKEQLSPLKVLEPLSCLRRTADYRKKMMIDHEGSIVLASIGDSSVHEENAMTEPFNTETDVPQIQENVESPITPVSLAFVTDPVDPTGNRKLNLETVAVRLPSTIRDSNKDLPEQSEDQNVHHNETDNSVRMSLPTASPVTVSSIDTPISFPLEEPTVCSSIIMGSNTVAQTHNILAPSHMDVQEVVELPSTPLTILPDKTLSSNNVTVLPKSSGLSGIIPDSGKLLLTESCKKLISNPLQKIMKKKPGNALTNYFKPVSITLTADEDEVEQTRKGGARTIHLSIEPVPTTAATTMCSNTAVEGQTSDSLSDVIPTIIENDNEILEASSMSSVEVSTTTMDSVEHDGSLSPVKVVVEKVEDFSLTKTFAALETMTPVFNIENGKVSPQSKVSSSSRRKTRSPLRRTPEDPKLPPFKTSTKPISESEITEQGVLSIEKSSKLNTKSEKKMKNEKQLKSVRPSLRGRKSKSTRMAKVENNTDTENNTLDENTSPSLLQAPSKRKYKPRKSKAKLLDIAEDLKAIKEGTLASLETISNSDDKKSISETKLCLTPLEVKTKKLAVDVIEEATKVSESHNIESSTHKLNEFDSDKNNDLADVSNLNEVDTIKTSALIESEKQNTLGSIEELRSKCNNEVNITSEKMDKQSLPNKTVTLNLVNNEDEMNEQVNSIENVDTKSNKSDKEIISDSSKIKKDETKETAQTRSDKQKEIVSKEKDANLAKKSKTDVNTPKKDIRSLFPKVKLSPTKEKNTSHGKNRSFCGISDPRLLRQRRTRSELNISISTPYKVDEPAIKNKLAQVVIEPCSSIIDPKLSRHRKSLSHLESTSTESPKKADSVDSIKLRRTVKELSVNISDSGQSKHTKSIPKLEIISEPLEKDVSAVQNKLQQALPDLSISIADARLSRHKKDVSKLDSSASEILEKEKSDIQDRKSVPKLDTSTSETSGKDKSDVQDKLTVTVCETSASNTDPRLLRHKNSLSKLNTSTSETPGKDKSDVQDKIAVTVCETSASNTDPRLLRHRKSVSKFDTCTSETLGKDKSDIQDKLVLTFRETSASNADPRPLRHRKSMSKLDTSISERPEKDKSDVQDKLAVTVCETSASNADPRLFRHKKSMSKLDISTSERPEKDKSNVQDKLAVTVCETSASNADPRLFRHKKSMSKLDISTSERPEKDKSDVQDKLAMIVCEMSTNNADPRLFRHKKSMSKLDTSTSEKPEKDKSDVQDKLAVTVCETSASNADPRLFRHKKSMSRLDTSTSERPEKDKSDVQDKLAVTSASNADPRLLRHRKSVTKLDCTHSAIQEKNKYKSEEVAHEASTCIVDPRKLRQKKIELHNSLQSESQRKDKSAVQNKSVCEISSSIADPRLLRQRKSTSKLVSASSIPAQKDEYAVQSKLSEFHESSVNNGDPRFSKHRKSVPNFHSTITVALEESESATSNKLTELGSETSISIVDPRFSRHRKSISQLNFSNSGLPDKSEFASQKKVAELVNNTSSDKFNSETENSVSITSNTEVKESISNKRKRTKRKIDKDFIGVNDFMPKERRRKLNKMESDVSKNRKSTLLSSTSDITNKVFAEKCRTAMEKFDVPETLEDIEKEIKALTEGSHAEVSVTHNFKAANSSDKESRLAEISEEKVSQKKPRYSVVEDKAHASKQPLNVLSVRRSRNLCSTISKSNKKMKGEFEKSLQSEPKVVPETQSLNSHSGEGISKLKDSQESEPKTNLDQQLSEAVIEMSEMFQKQNSNKETPKNSDKFKEIISSTSGLKENIPPIEKIVEDVHSIPESLDIIESSQESITSVSIVGRPIMHKCSVTVRRIDTTLEPGSKIDMSQGDQKLLILVPEDPGSPYKLFSPEKCNKNDENCSNNSKLLSITKSLTSKLEAVQENIHESCKITSLKDQSKKEESNEIKLLNKEKDCVESEISVLKIIKDDVLKTKPKRNDHQKSEDKVKDVTKSDTPKQLPESEEKTKDFAKSKSRHLLDIEEKSENSTKSVTLKPKSKQLPNLEEKIKDVTKSVISKSKPKQLPDSEEKTKDFTKSFTPKLKSKQLLEVMIPEETKIESSKTSTEITKQSDSSLAGLETPKFRLKKSNFAIKPEDNVIQEESAPKLQSKKQDLLSEISSDTSKSRCQDMEVSVTSDDGPVLQCEQEHNSTIIENKSKVIEKDDKTKGGLKQQDDKLKMNVTKADLIKHRSKLSISKLEDTDSNAVSKSKCKIQPEDVAGQLLQSRTKHSAPVPTEDAAPSSSKNDTAKLKTKQSIVESTSSSDNSQKLKAVQQIDSVKTKDLNKSPVKDRQKSDENNAVLEDITKVKQKISSDRKIVQDLKGKPDSSIQDTNTTSKTEKDGKKSDTLKNKLESTVLNKTVKKIHDVESPKKSKPREDSSFKLRIIEESISGSDSKNNKDDQTIQSYEPSSKAVQIKVSVALKENDNPLVSSPSKRKESDISSEEISNEDRSIEMVVSKIKRLAQNSEHFIPKQVQNIQNSVAKKCQDINSTPTKLSTSNSDSEKTPSPSPTRPILTSPSSLLKAFSSPSSGNLKLSQKSHQRRIEGRAQYMVGLAVGTSQQEDSQVSSPISSRGHQEVKSIMTTPVSRKRLLYTLSDDDTVPLSPELDRRRESDMEHESSSQTPVSESRISSDLPVKRVLKQNTGEQDTPPSKKKRVWFPDPEVSGTRVFTAYEEMEDGSVSRSYSKTKMMLGLKKKDRKLRMTKLRSPTTVSTKKVIRPANIVQNDILTQSQNSPDLTGIVSQGSIEDVFTELLNSQDSFFPPLVPCMHPIESIAHQLTTHVMWTKALVVELNRKGIRTVGDLSRLDEASINRLPVATPRIAHTREVLENYLKIVGQGSDKGDGHPNGDSTLTPSPQSTEPLKITTADVVRFMNLNKGNLSSLLEEVCNSSQCSDRLNQEICQVLCRRNTPSNSASGSSEPEESVSEIVARLGRDTIVEHLLRTDTMHLRPTHSIILKSIMTNGVENILGKLPQLELARYIVKNNSEGLCKVLTENPALQEKVFQNYFNSQLATGQLCHKDLFDKLFTGDRNNTLLNAMQSFLMLKKSTEEILHKMPVESVMQFATSRLSLVDKIGLCVEGMLIDTSLEVPVNHYHKLVHAVAKKVSHSDFATINYKVMMELLDKD